MSARARTPGIKAPADKRFRRAQVRPAGKRSWRSAVSWGAVRLALIGAAVTFVAFKGAGAALQSEQLRVQHIVIRGAEKLSTGEVEALVDGLRGDHVLTADLDAYRAKLTRRSAACCPRRSRLASRNGGRWVSDAWTAACISSTPPAW
jgi:hypothetical protein